MKKQKSLIFSSEMQRVHLCIFLVIVIMILFSACTSKSNSNEVVVPTLTLPEFDSTAETPNHTIIPSVEPSPIEAVIPPFSIEPAPEYDEDMTFIAAIPAYVRFSDDYDVFTSDNSDMNEVFERRNFTKEKMDSWISLSGDELRAIPKSEPLQEPAFLISIRVKSGEEIYEQIGNLSSFTDIDLDYFAEGLLMGFNVVDYEILKTNGSVFIVFDWDSPTGKQQRYATIINSKMIYLYSASNDKLTDNNRDELRKVVDSFVITL
jgi:hypothetical protein